MRKRANTVPSKEKKNTLLGGMRRLNIKVYLTGKSKKKTNKSNNNNCVEENVKTSQQ